MRAHEPGSRSRKIDYAGLLTAVVHSVPPDNLSSVTVQYIENERDIYVGTHLKHICLEYVCVYSSTTAAVSYHTSVHALA